MVQDSGYRRVFKKGLSNTSLIKKDENYKEKEKKMKTEMTNDEYFSSSTFVTEAEDINIFMFSLHVQTDLIHIQDICSTVYIFFIV